MIYKYQFSFWFINMQEKSKKSEFRIIFYNTPLLPNIILSYNRFSDLMPSTLYQISKRYTVCLLCKHYKIGYILLKMNKKTAKVEFFN
ncbi:hypothetical protein ASG14_05565 [Pedobacter sp. Leaf194]|nr:hypothetical protein ASG14_05565 [Pedobacter sp. Leaf194]